MRTLRSLLGALFRLATYLLVVATVMRVFFVDVFEMPHNGMAPTLLAGDHVLVWRNGKPDLGDIMLCQHPARPEASVIGRVVAFAGHTVSTDTRGELYVDEDRGNIEWQPDVHFFDTTRQKLFDMRHGTIDYGRKHRHDFFVEQGTTFQVRTYTVQRGIYLLGDNRSDSWDDSRDFGEVDPAKCKGQVFGWYALSAPERHDDVAHGYVGFVL
jgi:signal peptidase I